MSKDKDLVYRVLRLFVVELRTIYNRLKGPYYKRFPNAGHPCASCAFQPATDDWTGWDNTAYHMMQSLRDERPFYCHANLPWTKDIRDWTTEDHQHFHDHAKLCSAYAVIMGDPESKKAFIRAAAKAQAIDLATCTIPGAGDIL